MAAEILVGPTEANPTHHIKLKQGTEEIGLVLCDEHGDFQAHFPKIVAGCAERVQKFYSGVQDYLDKDLPYVSALLDDFSHGRGHESWAAGEYYDGKRCDVWSTPGRVLLGGQETHCFGDYRDQDSLTPGNVGWVALYGDTRFYATPFVASASYSMRGVALHMRMPLIGFGCGAIRVSLYADVAGVPSGELAHVEVESVDIVNNDVLAVEYFFEFDSAYSVVAATKYWFVIDGGTLADSLYHIEVGNEYYVDPTPDGRIGSTLGSLGAEQKFYYRGLDDTSAVRMVSFMYKGALYAFTQPDTGNSVLYLNGWRGTADSNAANYNKLFDATQTGWSSADIGSIVVIIDGPGSEEVQPWRVIKNASSGQATMTSAWNVGHTTDTEYVILRSQHWGVVADLGGRVTDFAVAAAYVYFAFGHAGPNVKRFRDFNNAGVWTYGLASEDLPAKYLEAVYNSADGKVHLWGSISHDISRRSYVWEGTVPETWDDLYTDLGLLAPTDRSWASVGYSNVDQHVEWGMAIGDVLSAFTTGNCLCLNLDAAVDITLVDSLYFRIYSSVSVAAGDMRFVYADGVGLGGGSESYDIPALVAGEWTWVMIAIPSPTAAYAVDASAVMSVGIEIVVDNGAQQIKLDNGIRMARGSWTEVYLDASEITAINALLLPGGGGYPLVHTAAGSVYEILADNKVVELTDDHGVYSYLNGRAFVSWAGAAWFNFGSSIYKYNDGFEYVMDSRNFPTDRQGRVVGFAVVFERLYLALDAGDEGYSSILLFVDGGWHEFYRGRLGERIWAISYQSMPGEGIGRLWVFLGADILYLPIARNPEAFEDYPYVHEAVIETGRIVFVKGIEAFLKSVSVVSEHLGAGKIVIDYSVDNAMAAAEWVEIGSYSVSPYQREFFSSEHDQVARWVALRFRLRTTDSCVSPVFTSALIEAMFRHDVDVEYILQFRLGEGDANFNLQRDIDDVPGSAKLAQLDAWLSSPAPIQLYSNSLYENDVWAFLSPYSVESIKVDYDEGDEVRVCKLKLRLVE